MKKTLPEYRELEKTSHISTKSLGIEVVYHILKMLGKSIDLKKRFRIILDYDPESLNATIDFYE